MAAFRDTVYNITGSGTAFDLVIASKPPAAAAGSEIPITLGFCRHMEVKETFAAGGAPAPLGLQVQFWNRETQAFGPTIQYAPGETVYVGDTVAEGQGQGAVLGLSAQATFFPDAHGTTSRAADVPLRIISGTAAATLVKVREYQ